MSNSWIICGGSPNGQTMLDEVMRLHPDATTMGTNIAIRWFNGHRLDCYFLFDLPSLDTYRAESLSAQQAGTRLVTALIHPEKIAELDREWFDEVLPLESPPFQFHKLSDGLHCFAHKFSYGKYWNVGWSGLLVIQYAINHGATDLHVLGMEGYGEDAPYSFRLATHDVIRPFTQSIIDACPGVQFTFYGDLEYRLRGDNVTEI